MVSSPALTVVRGDVLDPAAVDETVAGSDVVLSLFGHVKGSPRTLQTDGTRLIVDAMARHGVPRIVTLSGGGLSAPLDRPKAPDRIIRLLLKTVSGTCWRMRRGTWRSWSRPARTGRWCADHA